MLDSRPSSYGSTPYAPTSKFFISCKGSFKLHLRKQVDNPQTIFYISYCKYCGRPFIKTHNRIMYCSSECKCYALKEQKAIYQQKRRLLIKNGEIIRMKTEN